MQRIEYVRLSAVECWPRNPKAHDLSAIQASLRRFGFVAPIVRDDSTGRLVAGHGRLEALLGLRRTGQTPPARIEVEADGEWLVPVLCGVSFANEREAEAYLLADNRLTEVGGWEEALLVEALRDLRDVDGLAGIGWSSREVDALIRAADRAAAQAGDEPADAPAGDDLLDASGTADKEVVLHVSTQEDYVSLVSRLQSVMRETGASDFTGAVEHLLEFWEADRIK
jgi:hypothetical protein